MAKCKFCGAEVGSVRRVQVKKGDTREVHHFRVLEELKSV